MTLNQDYPVSQFGDGDREFLFLGGNGFFPGSYVSFFEGLDQCRVSSPLLPHLNGAMLPDKGSFDWFVLVDALALFLTQKKESKPLIVGGHSVGATLWMMLGIKYQVAFDALVLIEPALFSRHLYYVYWFLYVLGMHRHVHPMIKRTLNRKRVFESLEAIVTAYRQKLVFSRVPDVVLRQYAVANFEKKEDGFYLKMLPEWESLIFEHGILHDPFVWKGISQLDCPVLYVRGQVSNVGNVSVQNRLQRLHSQVKTVVVEDTTHLLPFEKPDVLSAQVNAFFKEVL